MELLWPIKLGCMTAHYEKYLREFGAHRSLHFSNGAGANDDFVLCEVSFKLVPIRCPLAGIQCRVINSMITKRERENGMRSDTAMLQAGSFLLGGERPLLLSQKNAR